MGSVPRPKRAAVGWNAAVRFVQKIDKGIGHGAMPSVFRGRGVSRTGSEEHLCARATAVRTAVSATIGR
jgi:hypothetical protein